MATRRQQLQRRGKIKYQVVAVGKKGREFAVRGPHDDLNSAQLHLQAAKRMYPDEKYRIRRVRVY